MLDLKILDYTIKSNNRNIILTKKKEDHKLDVVLGYYGTIDQALNALLEHRVLSKDSNSIESINELKEELDKTLNEIKLKKDDILSFLKTDVASDDPGEEVENDNLEIDEEDL